MDAIGAEVVAQVGHGWVRFHCNLRVLISWPGAEGKCLRGREMAGVKIPVNQNGGLGIPHRRG